VPPGILDGSPSARLKDADEIADLLDRVAPDDASEEAKAAFRELHADPQIE
jgi:hypothetical protein